MSSENMDREPRISDQQHKDIKNMRKKSGEKKQENKDEEMDSGCGC